MAARVWSAAADGVWSLAANWDGGVTVPQAGDTVTFNSTSVKNCTIDNIGAFNGSISTTFPGGYTGVITQGVSLSGIGALAINGGTWNCATFDLNVGTNAFSVGANATFNGGSGTITCGIITANGAFTSTSGTLNVSGDGTFFAGAYGANGGTITFNALDGTLHTWTAAVSAATLSTFRRIGSGSGTLVFSGTFSFSVFRDNDGLVAHTLTFAAGVTYTAASWLFPAPGNSNLLTIVSSSGGSAATLHTTGGAVMADFMSIKDSTVDVAPTWRATNSTNVSGNTNWLFGAAPSGGVLGRSIHQCGVRTGDMGDDE